MIPKKLQANAIALAQEDHQKMNKTLSQLREKVWFRRMADMVKEYVEICNLDSISRIRQEGHGRYAQWNSRAP